MSIHVCKCNHKGGEEYHLRYPGMTQEAAQDLADRINSGFCTAAEAARLKAENAAMREALADSIHDA